MHMIAVIKTIFSEKHDFSLYTLHLHIVGHDILTCAYGLLPYGY